MRTYTYNELKESRLIYDRKPPAFGIIITSLTLLLLISAIIWANVSVKTYVVKSTGIVTSEQKVNVMNSVSGEIKTICVSEGQNVNKGDILLTMDTFQVDLQIKQLEALVNMYDEKIHGINKLIDFVNQYSLNDDVTQENPFDENVDNDLRLFSIADTFIKYVESQVKQYELQNTEYTQNQLDSNKIQFLSQQSVYAYLDEYISQRVQQQSQLTAYTDSLSAYTIKAEMDGIVHMTPGIAQGTVIQAGVLVGNIVAYEPTNFVLDVAISATDRSKVKIDSEVEIAIGGITQTEYGVLNGKVISIDSDSTQSEEGVFYHAKIKPMSCTLANDNGDTVQITTGMIGECRVKYDETTWMKWAIEQVIGKIR